VILQEEQENFLQSECEDYFLKIKLSDDTRKPGLNQSTVVAAASNNNNNTNTNTNNTNNNSTLKDDPSSLRGIIFADDLEQIRIKLLDILTQCIQITHNIYRPEIEDVSK
jgi:hypothetical protein